MLIGDSRSDSIMPRSDSKAQGLSRINDRSPTQGQKNQPKIGHSSSWSNSLQQGWLQMSFSHERCRRCQCGLCYMHALFFVFLARSSQFGCQSGWLNSPIFRLASCGLSIFSSLEIVHSGSKRQGKSLDVDWRRRPKAEAVGLILLDTVLEERKLEQVNCKSYKELK